jgi:hypothetical protein
VEGKTEEKKRREKNKENGKGQFRHFIISI